MSTSPKTADSLQAVSNPDISVMVISQQTAVRLTVGRYLQGLGHRIFNVRTGREAIEVDGANMVDVIVFDAPLADMPVREMLIAIREQRRLMRDIVDSSIVPCIMFSSQPGAASSLGSLGVVASLQKPLNLKALNLCVKKVLAGELTVDADRIVHIAVMDPEVRALSFFSKLLKADDTEICELTDLFDVRDALEEQRAQVLILEVVGLPGEPLDEMKKLMPRCAQSKVIVCTALHDQQMHKDLLDLGVNEVITKPINPFSMRALVRQYVTEVQNEKDA